MKRILLLAKVTMAVTALLWLMAEPILADGTETLGTPSLSLNVGTGIVAAGVGLHDTGTGTINVNVPGTVQQAILYWAGAATDLNPPDDIIMVNGSPVTGTLIGGPAFFFSAFGKEFNYTNYRADITGMVSTGANSLDISGLDFLDGGGNGENSGAGLLVIFDDGSPSTDIQLLDGLDLAFDGFPEPRRSTVPQTFDFAPVPETRTAELVIFAGSVGEEGSRTSIIRTTAGVSVMDMVNLFASVDGDLWDTLTFPVTIPANVSQLVVEVISGDGTGGSPASLNWVGAGLSVPPGEENGEGCTPGYWKNHHDAWIGLSPGDDFDTTFGVDFFDPDITLGRAVRLGGGGIKKVARHGTAALLNALHPAVDYPASAAEVIAAVQAQDVEALAAYNELSDSCPAEDY